MSGQNSMSNQPTQPGKLPEEVQKKIAKQARMFASTLTRAYDDVHKVLTEWAEKWWEEKQSKEAFQDLASHTGELLNKAVSERNAVQQENVKLKAALKEITKQETYYHVVEIASKALASGGKEVENGSK